jgi:hypothetical protein
MKCCAVLISLMLALYSCKSKNDLPGDVMPPEKMQRVLWDVLRTDAYAFNYIKNDSTKKTEAEVAKIETQVFSVHKISKEQFFKSYDFYKTHPDLMQVMLDSLVNKYTREKQEALKPAHPFAKDTLKAQ